MNNYYTLVRKHKLSIFRLCAVTVALFSLTAMQINAQVLVTGGSASVNYKTLKGAFDAVNAGTFTGTINIGINSNTNETASAVLNSSGAGSANYTSVTIRPTNDGVSISGATAKGRGLIELNGADNVTIDGDNATTAGTNRNLNIINTAANTTAFTSVVRIVASASVITSANNNTVKNCNIAGSAAGRNISSAINLSGSEYTTFGILAGPWGPSAPASATAPPAAVTSVAATLGMGGTLTNLLLNNNSIDACARGIAVMGSSVTVANNLSVTDNLIGNDFETSTTTVYCRGITVQGFDNTLLCGNRIRNIQSFVRFDNIGISLGFEGTPVGQNGVVDRNIITNVNNQNTNTFGAFGINVAAGNNITVKNNFISRVTGDISGNFAFSTTFGIFGIKVDAGTGHKIYHNSVNLYGVRSGDSSATQMLSAAFGITSTLVTGCDVRNNIFVNKQSGGSSSVAYVSLFLPSAGGSFMALNLNNNAYYSGINTSSEGIAQVGTTSGTGFYIVPDFNSAGSASSTNLRAYSSTLSSSGTNDDHSLASANPTPVLSNADLHIETSSAEAVALSSTGAAVGVKIDIDGNMRKPVPDIGADEFIVPSCAGKPSGGIAYSSPASLACSGKSYITLTGQSGGTGITYQWQVSNNGTTFTNIPGATGSTLNTSTLFTTSYFCARVTCTSSGQAANSTIAMVTIDSVSAGAAVASPTAICPGAASFVSLNGASTTGVTYQWQSSPNNTTWSNISGATTPAATVYPTTSTYYKAKVTCMASGVTDVSSPTLVTVNSASYAPYNGTLFTESFEAWTSLCSVNDVPSSNFKNTPVAGDNSWRRDDEGEFAGWNNSIYGIYSPVSSTGLHSARFHSYSAVGGTTGKLDLYINMSGAAGASQVKFDYINTSGDDALKLYVSTNGGASFTQAGTILTTASAWTPETFNINSTSVTTIIRLQAISDFGFSDIGVDNFKVIPACAATAKMADPIAGRFLNLCGGGMFTYSIKPVSGATSYLWTVPATFTVQNNGTSANVQIPADFTGTATISVAAVNDCGPGAQRMATLYAVAPDPSSVIQGLTNVPPGATVVYSLPNEPGIYYTWVVPQDVTILDGQGTNKIRAKFPNANESGFIKVTVKNACGTSPEGKKLVTSGSTAKSGQPEVITSALMVYPNPTTSTATVVFTAAEQESKFEIIVRDVTGKSLINKSGIANLGENQVNIDLSKYVNGMYLITVITEKKSSTLKLYKDK